VGRRRFIYDGVLSKFVFSLTTGTYLAGFVRNAGADDSASGLIASIPIFALTLQLMSPILFERLHRRKKPVLWLGLCHKILLGSMGFIPFFIPGIEGLYLIGILYLLGQACNALAVPMASNWLLSLTDSDLRGRYFGRRESYVLFFTPILGLLCGWMLDHFRKIGEANIGFLILSVLVLAFGLIDFAVLSGIPEPAVPRTSETYRIREAIRVPLQDRRFRKVIGLVVLFSASIQIAIPFTGVYMIHHLQLDYSYIMLIGMMDPIVMVLFARIWGRLVDRTSWTRVMMYLVCIYSFGQMLWFFNIPSNTNIVTPVCQLIGGIVWSGMNMCLFNIPAAYAPVAGRTIYLGLFSTISGLSGFAFSILATRVVRLLEGRTIDFLSMQVTGIQMLFASSSVLLVACALYIRFRFKEDHAVG
jgi:MFS family permease